MLGNSTVGAQGFAPLYVVPTRNRAELAEAAVCSLLAEADERLIVWVSDNSTDAAEIKLLRNFCSAHPDPRLRYIRPVEPLSMGRHWDWIIDQALADPMISHVGFLTDRMLFVPGALSMLFRVIARYPHQVLAYPHDHVDDLCQPVQLIQNEWTSRLLEVPSVALIKDMLHNGWNRASPRMLNSLAPRSFLASLRDVYGNVLESTAPDICFAFRALEQLDTFLYLDRPLVVDYALARSNGHSATLGKNTSDHIDFLNQIGQRGLNYAAPVPGLVCTPNACFHEYNLVREHARNPKLKRLNVVTALDLVSNSVQLIENPDQRAVAEGLIAHRRHEAMRGTEWWYGLFLVILHKLFAKATLFYLKRKLVKTLFNRFPDCRSRFWRRVRRFGLMPYAKRTRMTKWPDRQQALNCVLHDQLEKMPARSSLEYVMHLRLVEIVNEA